MIEKISSIFINLNKKNNYIRIKKNKKNEDEIFKDLLRKKLDEHNLMEFEKNNIIKIINDKDDYKNILISEIL
jgi:hypothetical protein